MKKREYYLNRKR